MVSTLFLLFVAQCQRKNWWVSSVVLLMAIFSSIFNMNKNFSVEIDLFYYSSLSCLMVLLSILLCFLCLITTPSLKSVKYLFWIISLGIVLSVTFTTDNVLVFYIFFEVALIPTLVLILGWGYQPERLQAGSYMMLYTITASLPLLVLILWRMSLISCCSMSALSYVPFSSNYWVFLLFVILAFLVKLPIYSAHLWLPKAHVEAPLAGSMILAGILLKLGGYGITRMVLTFSLGSISSSFCIMVCLSMWGALLASFMCLQQSDMKALVAYSSVAHMGIVSVGFLMDSTYGLTSATITMVAHGVISPAMFCLAYFTYEKYFSRSLTYVSGLLVAFPTLSLMWFLFNIINMAAPGTLNLLGELLIVPTLFMGQWTLVVIMGLMVFFSAVYNMYLYCSVNHGVLTSSVNMSSPMRAYEMVSLLSHLMLLFILLKSSYFIM